MRCWDFEYEYDGFGGYGRGMVKPVPFPFAFFAASRETCPRPFFLLLTQRRKGATSSRGPRDRLPRPEV